MGRFQTWLAGFAVVSLLLAAAPGLAKPPPSWAKKIGGTGRFKVLKAFDSDAVLDQETGLVWLRAPDSLLRPWVDATKLCRSAEIADRKGWRAPTVSELSSLVDLTQSSPALPPGHPFGGSLSNSFWTATTRHGDPTRAWLVNLNTGIAAITLKTSSNKRWCVRAPGGADGGH